AKIARAHGEDRTTEAAGGSRTGVALSPGTVLTPLAPGIGGEGNVRGRRCRSEQSDVALRSPSVPMAARYGEHGAGCECHLCSPRSLQHGEIRFSTRSSWCGAIRDLAAISRQPCRYFDGDARYHWLSNASSTVARRSPYGWIAGAS